MTQTQPPAENAQNRADPQGDLSALGPDTDELPEVLLPNLGDEDTDEDTTWSHARPSPRALIADACLRAALTPHMRRGLLSGRISALVVEVPGRDWVAPISAAAERLFERATILAHDGSARSSHKPDRHGDDVSGALANGRRIVGVSQAPAQYLPSVLTTVADTHLRIRGPNASLLRRLLREVTGKRLSSAAQVPVLTGLSFEEIVSAFRPRLKPRQIVTLLAAYVDARSRVTAADDTPPLDELPGYNGPARDWAQALARDLADYRAGEIPWKKLAASCVFHGPPGTGKTLFAKALARTLKTPIVVTSCGAWFRSSEGHLGDVIQAMQRDFDSARALTPAILFIDELDGIPDRAALTRGRDWWTPVVNHLLTLLDGAETPREGLIVIAATNHPSRLDQALIRPGRLDRLIGIAPPDATTLAAMLRRHLGDALAEVDLLPIVRLTPGATPADAAQWAKDALGRARAAGRTMTSEDLVAVVAPPDDRSRAERRIAAVHEAGHATVYVAMGIELESVSLVSRGESGGCTRARNVLSGTPTRAEIEASIVAVLSGRAAEEIVLGAPSTGAVGDLALATNLLAQARAKEGLADSLLHRAESLDTLLSLDRDLRAAVDADLARLYQRALALIRERREAVDAIAVALLERRFLGGQEIHALLTGAEITPGP